MSNGIGWGLTWNAQIGVAWFVKKKNMIVKRGHICNKWASSRCELVRVFSIIIAFSTVFVNRTTDPFSLRPTRCHSVDRSRVVGDD